MISSRTPDLTGAAHDRVYRSLRARIMHGELEPGASLTLRGIAKHYEVSMTPARESVRRLAAEGALQLSSSGRITTPALSNERIEELATLRALLEPELATRDTGDDGNGLAATWPDDAGAVCAAETVGPAL